MKKLIIISSLILTANLLSGQIINIPSDYTTIQQGINAASNGDTVLVDSGTYNEAINYNGKNIIVASYYLTTLDTSYISQTIIDAYEKSTSVVKFQNGEDSTALLCGFTLQNGNTISWDEGGGICCKNSNPQLKYLTINNNSSRLGGGVYFEDATINMTHVNIFNNYAWSSSGSGGYGGGINCTNADINLFDCNITGNRAGTLGGGIYCSNSNLYLENVLINNDTAWTCDSPGQGGGIYVSGSDLTLINVNINNNYSGSDGGGLFCTGATNISFDSSNRCSIHSNESQLTKDIYSNDFLEVILDTFTVMYPTTVHAAPLENLSFDILYGIINQANADLYVSPDGDNTNSGLTAENPLQTISFAFSKILSDSLDRKKIHLLEGTYSAASNGEAFPIYMIENVDLAGIVDSLVILNAGSGVSRVIILDNKLYNISGLTVTGGHDWYWGGGLRCNGTKGVLQNLIIRDNYGGLNGGGILMEGDTCPLMVNVRIYNNTANVGSGMHCSGSNPVLQNVVISDNSASGKAGLYLSNSSPTLINCTLSNNGERGIMCKNSNPVLINTIIWNHLNEAIRFEDNSNNSISVSWSDIENGEDGIVTNNNGVVYWLDGNINENPLFEGSGAYPYQFSAASPCIDLGTPDTTGLNLPTSDIIGNKRIWDGDNNGSEIIDMGAYEYGSLPASINEPIMMSSLNSIDLNIFPNPFHQSTAIELVFKEKRKIALSIYNQLGEKVESIFKGNKEKGTYQLTWNSENLSSGIYFIKLETEKGITTQKIIKK